MNKLSMITGASEGIGREFARQLAERGYAVTAVARNKNRLAELCRELGSSHRYIVADLTLKEDVERIQTELKMNHYHLLINNAGSGIYKEFSFTPLKEIQQMTALNIDALIALSHAFLGKAEAGDALVNVSSTLAFLPSPSAGAYAASKAFVTSFTESLWYEYKKRSIYVMELCPGITRSRFHERAGGKPENFPQAIAETPEQLVRKVVKVLEKRSGPIYISGFINKMFAGFSRVLSREAIVKMMGRSKFG
jgi:hypothetical protein